VKLKLGETEMFTKNDYANMLHSLNRQLAYYKSRVTTWERNLERIQDGTSDPSRRERTITTLQYNSNKVSEIESLIEKVERMINNA
jgi:hypothetical protein